MERNPEMNEDMFKAFLEKYSVDEDARVLDIRTVLKMFHQLQQTSTGQQGQQGGQDLGDLKTQLKQEIDEEVNKAVQAYEERIKSLEMNLHQSDKKIKLMQEIMIRSNDLVSDLSKRLDAVELNQARKMAILTGLKVSTKKQDRLKEIVKFIQDEMETFTRIEDTYLLGNGDIPPIVITFQTMHDKEVVFKNKSKLKQTSSDRGINIFINNYVPAVENEKRKRERKLISEAKEQSRDTSYKKGGLYIGNSNYRKKILPPDPTQLLTFTSDELDEILAKSTMKGPELRIKGSVFVPYAIDVADYKTVIDVYMKIRLLHAPARHIVCAHILPGPEQEAHHLRDSCDDGENGAGAMLLKAMEQSDISHKAFFIVRYCGDEKLGSDRMSKYVEAAENLLKLKPMNKLLNKKQQFSLQKPPTKMKYKYSENMDIENNDLTTGTKTRSTRNRSPDPCQSQKGSNKQSK